MMLQSSYFFFILAQSLITLSHMFHDLLVAWLHILGCLHCTCMQPHVNICMLNAALNAECLLHLWRERAGLYTIQSLSAVNALTSYYLG